MSCFKVEGIAQCVMPLCWRLYVLILYYNIDFTIKVILNNIQDSNKLYRLDISRYFFLFVFLLFVITVFMSSTPKEHMMAFFWAIVLIWIKIVCYFILVSSHIFCLMSRTDPVLFYFRWLDSVLYTYKSTNLSHYVIVVLFWCVETHVWVAHCIYQNQIGLPLKWIACLTVMVSITS